ncbi:MAG: TlyA family RNA methyltransferase [Propionibacteriaceae bacterium]|jgi:23S rRNA (cytidine1920-2'-O)/16S rRNA (cytidine1409-2'-O)-methyltransferase|nr:TlyA family RNA methyltransferase [Propionibacteriaceae bacterium]
MIRLDLCLVRRGLARSRSHARQLIEAGRVTVPGATSVKPALLVSADQIVSVVSDPYVSRGAHKLIGALDQSGMAVPPRVVDVGASTGGFTQVLLERGATTVFALDVGHNQLNPLVASDRRVIRRDGINARQMGLADLDGRPVDLAVMDLSFISLRLVLPAVIELVTVGGSLLTLVKPQFEVGRSGLDQHGVVKDEQLAQASVDAVATTAAVNGCHLVWSGRSVLVGEHGNQEYFCWFQRRR